jgi:hypothetical protein
MIGILYQLEDTELAWEPAIQSWSTSARSDHILVVGRGAETIAWSELVFLFSRRSGSDGAHVRRCVSLDHLSKKRMQH